MKIFISHSHIDSDIANALVDFLTQGIGVEHSAIFCSSSDGKDVPLGLNFNEYILNKLQGEDAEVLCVVSNNYYNSKYCLYELGAAWGLCRKITPILIPPMQYANLRDFLSQSNAVQATIERDLNKLKDELQEKFKQNNPPTTTFERTRKVFIDFVKQASKKQIPISVSKLISNTRHLYKYKAVAFDFDCTLLHGESFEYSWKEVWEHLKFDDTKRKELYFKHKNKSNNYSYEQWCTDCGEYFIKERFHKNQIAEIIAKKKLKPAEGLYTMLYGLKKHGFKTAIISGGIDTFYELGIDDRTKALIDKVYMNTFQYDKDGFLEKVIPYQTTESDFIGKVMAFEEFCTYANCSLNEGVFVGEGFNDIDLAAHLNSNDGLVVAYPEENAEKEFKEYAQIRIKDNNISALLYDVLIPAENKKNHHRGTRK